MQNNCGKIEELITFKVVMANLSEVTKENHG
jgi:hypothetical protein